MERCIQFEVIKDPGNDLMLDILALSEDGRLFLRRTPLDIEEYPAKNKSYTSAKI